MWTGATATLTLYCLVAIPYAFFLLVVVLARIRQTVFYQKQVGTRAAMYNNTKSVLAAGTAVSRRQLLASSICKPGTAKKSVGHAGKITPNNTVRFKFSLLPDAPIQRRNIPKLVARPITKSAPTINHAICTPRMQESVFLKEISVDNDYYNVKVKMGPEMRSVFDGMRKASGFGPCAQAANMDAIKLHLSVCTEPTSCSICKHLDRTEECDSDATLCDE